MKGGAGVVDYDAMLEAYDRCHNALQALQMEASGPLTDDDIDAVKHRLELLVGAGRFTGALDEFAMLADLALYSELHGYPSLLQRLLAGLTATKDPYQLAARQAAERARFSIFDVTDVEEGVGLHLVDRRGGGELFVVQEFLALMPPDDLDEVGQLLIGRLAPVDIGELSFSMMTTTAILPDSDVGLQIEEELAAAYPDHHLSELIDLSPDAESRFADYATAIALATQPPLDEALAGLAEGLAGMLSPAFLNEDETGTMLDDPILDAPFTVAPHWKEEGDTHEPSIDADWRIHRPTTHRAKAHSKMPVTPPKHAKKKKKQRGK